MGWGVHSAFPLNYIREGISHAYCAWHAAGGASGAGHLQAGLARRGRDRQRLSVPFGVASVGCFVVGCWVLTRHATRLLAELSSLPASLPCPRPAQSRPSPTLTHLPACLPACLAHAGLSRLCLPIPPPPRPLAHLPACLLQAVTATSTVPRCTATRRWLERG